MQAENAIGQGICSQLANLRRWGDYSAMAVYPVGHCTFWFTNAYLEANGTFNWSTWISSFKLTGCGVTSPPAAPTGLTATAGNGQVSLSWNASAGATSYNVLRSTGSNGEIFLATAATNSYTDTTVTNGTTYFYEVQAVNSAGPSGNSNAATATPPCTAPAKPPPNATPETRRVSLTWSALST